METRYYVLDMTPYQRGVAARPALVEFVAEQFAARATPLRSSLPQGAWTIAVGSSGRPRPAEPDQTPLRTRR
jgi:hypothetical protein